MAGVLVVIVLLAAATAQAEARPRERATGIAGVPSVVEPGQAFTVRARVPRGARVLVLLSPNRRADRRDRTIGRGRAPRGRGAKLRRARVRARIPAGARAGRWRVLVCVRTRRACRPARRVLTVRPRARGDLPAPQSVPAPASFTALPCRNGADAAAPDIGVAPGPDGVRGRVLPGRALRSEVVHGEPVPPFGRNPLDPAYPGGAYAAGPPAPQPAPGGTVIHAAAADARFNDEDALHRVAHHLSHYGGQPDSAGDFDGDGVEDLVVTEHFSYVDGMQYAGEVHLYYGRRGARLDPRTQVPDVIFYGDEAGAKLGLSVGSAGDVNGDGAGDLLMSAGFHGQRAADGTPLPNAGEVYVVYGGYLQRFGCTVKVRATDIGTKVPGLVLEGGHDGRRYTGWANDLESGDVNGDGLSDVLIGAADPYPGSEPTFAARAYLVYGSRALPSHHRGYRLGAERDRDGIRSAVFEAPDGEVTRQSLGWGAFVPGDLDGDGREEIVLCAGAAGPQRRGVAYVFRGTPGFRGDAVVALADADLTIAADDSADPALRFRRLESARPAGDVDGDGFQDLLLGARNTQQLQGGTWKKVGAAAIMHGRPLLPSALGLSELDTFLVGRSGGVGHPAMDRAADVDRDGHSDLLLNDPYFVETIGGEPQRRGRAWLIRGGPALPRTIDLEAEATRTFVADTSVPGMFGYTWNTGDFDADGRPDILIGDHYAGDRELHEHAGRVYLFYNGSSF